MKEKITLGIIGYGGFGKFIYQTLKDSAIIDVKSIADSHVSSSEIPGGIKFFKDWKKLLTNTAIDAVLVATPPSTHFEITSNAIESGKHVITEKPLTIEPDKAKKLEQKATEFDQVVMVDFLQRFNPLLKSLHELYNKQLFGPLERYLIENYAQDETLSKDHWFWDKKVSGGILIEHAVHFIDLVHWFDNQPLKSVHGNFDYRNNIQEDRAAAQIHYENGLIASHYHSFTRPDIFERTNMRFIFSNAQFDLNGWIPESGTFTLLGNNNTLDSLSVLPNLKISGKHPADNIPVRGKDYNYTHLITGSFRSSLSKEILYKEAITGIFEDFSQKIINRSHTLRVTLKDAVKAIEVAHKAKINQTTTNFHT
jgi:predicted dehydrogenase